MTEADDAVANSVHFEAKKDSCKQLQGGQWTLTLKLHPNDVQEPLMMAMPGQRYMCVLVALGDDETPLKGKDTARAKQKWDDMLPAAQAGVLCSDPEFQTWIMRRNGYGLATQNPGEGADHAKSCIYSEFNITSRSELGKSIPRDQWDSLVAEFKDATRETAEIR